MDQHLKMQNQNLQKNLKNKCYFKAPLPLCEITHAVIKHPTSHEEKKKTSREIYFSCSQIPSFVILVQPWKSRLTNNGKNMNANNIFKRP